VFHDPYSFIEKSVFEIKKSRGRRLSLARGKKKAIDRSVSELPMACDAFL